MKVKLIVILFYRWN